MQMVVVSWRVILWWGGWREGERNWWWWWWWGGWRWYRGQRRGLVGEAHSSSHYRRWLLWYFSLSISGGGGGGGGCTAIPRGGPWLVRPSSILTPPTTTLIADPPFLPHGRPCPASPLTAHLLTAITPSSSSPPSHRLSLYLPPLLHLSLSLFP